MEQAGTDMRSPTARPVNSELPQKVLVHLQMHVAVLADFNIILERILTVVRGPVDQGKPEGKELKKVPQGIFEKMFATQQEQNEMACELRNKLTELTQILGVDESSSIAGDRPMSAQQELAEGRIDTGSFLSNGR